MISPKKQLFPGTLNYSAGLFFLLAVMLSSCFPYYTDSSRKTTVKMAFRDCAAGVSLEKQYLGLEGDYHVVVTVRPSKDLVMKASDIRVSLTGFTPGKIRFWNVSANEPFDKPHPSQTPSIDPLQPETLIAGKVYSWVYTFNGRHRRKLKMDVSVTIDGESVSRNVDFSKHTQVSLFH